MTGAPARNLPALLQGLHEEGFTGTVRVSGAPGGTIHLRDGLIGAVETPGAPTATSVLLTPGRIDDEAWLAACAAERDVDRLGGQLVAAGLIGAAELEIVCTAAVFDAAFAMALGPPGSWTLSDPEPTLLATPGVEPRRLTEETTRRMVQLSGPWGAPGELARVRPTPVPGPGPGRWLPHRHQSVLNTVNGRRTARDIAFTLGRGLYAVMLDLTRLEGLELVRWDAGREPGVRPSTAPRVLPERRSATPQPSRSGAGSGSGSGLGLGSQSKAEPLPRRRPGGASRVGEGPAREGPAGERPAEGSNAFAAGKDGGTGG
ncbi:hypothetical protein QFZ24_003696 [Streptomyces phaeochromogenes]|uniref:DUF4388 domain-containing protein n=1 Tax=Streptomyces phaeochromogenes TaxID=1923 RepID=UPI002791EFE6|nr:DUF4388 domain-containing protein [Streptomyces phaeochromogenes]MDQ0949773.1 hypothetical protein [Streptomyces phaeochromogenes]